MNNTVKLDCGHTVRDPFKPKGSTSHTVITVNGNDLIDLCGHCFYSASLKEVDSSLSNFQLIDHETTDRTNEINV